MSIAHFGVGVFTIGVAGVEAYKIEKDVALKPGQSVQIAGYTFDFRGVHNVEGPNYSAVEGEFDVTRKGALVRVLRPQKRTYRVQTMPMTEAAITVGWTRDLFVALGDPLGGDAWSVRIQYKPLIRYIWLGAMLHGLGRPHCGLRPALSLGSRHRHAAGGCHRARHGLMWRYLLPARRSCDPGGVLFLRAAASAGRYSFAADRQARTVVLPPERRQPRPARQQRRLSRSHVRAQRLGHLVRRLPRRACRAARHRSHECGSDRRAQLERRATARHPVAQGTRQSVHCVRVRRRRPRRPSTGASMAHRRPSWWMRTAS